MNREWIDLDDAVGLTIERVALSHGDDSVLIALSGNKFAVVEATGELDQDDWVEVDIYHGSEFYHRNYKIEDLELIFDEATCAAWKEEYDRKSNEAKLRQEAEDRRQYERLKQQFETTAHVKR